MPEQALVEILAQEGKKDEAWVHEFGKAMGRALEFIHIGGLGHGALHAEAIMVLEQGDQLSVSLPPPISGPEDTPQQDLYAIGIYLYRALTGASPPPPGDLSDPRAITPEVSAPLANLVSRLLQPDPMQRPSHATEMLQLLSEESPGPPAEAPSVDAAAVHTMMDMDAAQLDLRKEQPAAPEATPEAPPEETAPKLSEAETMPFIGLTPSDLPAAEIRQAGAETPSDSEPEPSELPAAEIQQAGAEQEPTDEPLVISSDGQAPSDDIHTAPTVGQTDLRDVLEGARPGAADPGAETMPMYKAEPDEEKEKEKEKEPPSIAQAPIRIEGAPPEPVPVRVVERPEPVTPVTDETEEPPRQKPIRIEGAPPVPVPVRVVEDETRATGAPTEETLPAAKTPSDPALAQPVASGVGRRGLIALAIVLGVSLLLGLMMLVTYDPTFKTLTRHMTAAHAALNADEFDNALQEVDAALELAPEHTMAKDFKELKDQILAEQQIAAAIVQHLAQARDALEQQEFAPAIAAVDEALKLQKDHQEALTLRTEIKNAQAQAKVEHATKIAELLESARTALAAEDFNAADQALAELSSLAPEHAKALDLRAQWVERLLAAGQAHLAADEFDPAEARTKDVLAHSPEHAGARALLDEIQQQRQKFAAYNEEMAVAQRAAEAQDWPASAAALKRAEDAWKPTAELAEFRTATARLALTQARSRARAAAFDAAITHAQGSLALRDDPEVRTYLEELKQRQADAERKLTFNAALAAGEEHRKAKQWDQALTALNTALGLANENENENEKEKDQAEVSRRIAQVESERDREREMAAKKRENGKEPQPTAAKAAYDESFAKGLSLNRAGKFAEADKVFSNAIKQAPERYKAYYRRGFARARRGNFQLARDDFIKVTELNPQYALGWLNLGYTTARMKQYNEAIEHYTKAIQYGPGRAVSYSNRGLALTPLGKYDQAIRDFDQAINLRPDYARAYLGRARAYREQGDLPRARADCTRALEINDRDAEAYFQRALVWLQLNEQAQAFRDLNNAIKSDPTHVDAYNERGEFHERRGDLLKAMQDCQAALDLNPNHKAALANKRRISSKVNQ